MKFTPALSLLLLCGAASAQSLLVPESTVRAVFAVDSADGSLHSGGFMDLDEGAIPVNRPYQVVRVGSELWITDDVLNRITRWNAFGTVQLGAIDLSPHRLRGIAVGFGSVWVAGGTPGGTANDFLLELSTGGALLASHPMPGTVGGVIVVGSELLVTNTDEDQILRVDPGTGGVTGVFHDSGGVTGIDFPSGLCSLPNGHVLAGGELPPYGVFEYDAAGNEIAYYDTTSVGGASGVFGLSNGDIVFSSGSGVYVYDVDGAQISNVMSSVVPYYFSSVPDVRIGTNACGPAVPNSSGRSAEISATGSAFASDNQVRIAAHDLPTVQFGYFLVSETPGFVSGPGGSQGNLCLGGAIGRYNKQILFTGNDTFFSISIDLTQVPQPSGTVMAVAGETWRFQAWFRDKNPDTTSNFTDAVSVTLQ